MQKLPVPLARRRARVVTFLAYLNYKVSPLDNISFRPEFYNDMEGQRTGVKTRYVDFGIGWQHWFSPQIEIRPEWFTITPSTPTPSTAIPMRYRHLPGAAQSLRTKLLPGSA